MSFIPESPVASVVITVVSAFAGMLVGPAFARVGEIRDVGQPTALSTIFADAKAESGVIAQRTGRPRTSGKPMSDADRIALGVVVVVGLTIAYMSFRVPVLLGISALAVVVAILATISLVRMSRVGVIAGGRSFGAVVVGLFSSSALGILSVALLWSPLLGGDVLQRAVEQFAGKSGYGGLDGFVYVTLQMTGAVAYIFVAAACVAFSIGDHRDQSADWSMGAALVAVRVPIRVHRPVRLHTRLRDLRNTAIAGVQQRIAIPRRPGDPKSFLTLGGACGGALLPPGTPRSRVDPCGRSTCDVSMPTPAESKKR
jgi:hypothetical protein